MPKKLKDGGEVLTAQEDLFCLAFCEHYNQTKAAIESGYGKKRDGTINERSAAQQGYRLMQNELIKARINEIMCNSANEVGATRYYIAKKLKETADRCLQDIKPKMEWNPEEKCMEETGEFTFNAHGAVNALKTLAEIQGMKTNTVRIGNTEGERFELGLDADAALKELGYEKSG